MNCLACSLSLSHVEHPSPRLTTRAGAWRPRSPINRRRLRDRLPFDKGIRSRLTDWVCSSGTRSWWMGFFWPVFCFTDSSTWTIGNTKLVGYESTTTFAGANPKFGIRQFCRRSTGHYYWSLSNEPNEYHSKSVRRAIVLHSTISWPNGAHLIAGMSWMLLECLAVPHAVCYDRYVTPDGIPGNTLDDTAVRIIAGTGT